MRKKPRPKTSPLFLMICFPLILMGIGLAICFHSKGFKPAKINSKLEANEHWNIDPLTKSQHALLTEVIFPQTYYYLRSGIHTYSFVSEDNQYVIKFFKKESFSPKGWLTNYPLPFLRFLGFEVPSNVQFLSEHIFANYKSVYESLRCETGLIYIHLNKSREFRTKLRLVNERGKRYEMDLDGFEFAIQKKATLLFDKLESLIRSNDLPAFRQAVRSVFCLIATRCEKGFASQNIFLNKRFGFVGEQAIQFDCGILTKDFSMKYPLNIQKEILQTAERLELWAMEHYPEVSPIIQSETERILGRLL